MISRGVIWQSFIKKNWAHEQFPHFWRQRMMAHGACVWIVVQSTKSLSSIIFPFLVLMICWIWCQVPQYSPKLTLRVSTIKLEFAQRISEKAHLKLKMSYMNGWLCRLDYPMLLALSSELSLNYFGHLSINCGGYFDDILIYSRTEINIWTIWSKSFAHFRLKSSM